MMSVSLQPTPPPAVMHTFVHSRHIVLESRSNRIQTGTMRPFVRSCSFVRSFVRSATNNKDRLVTHRRQPAAPHSFPPTHSFSVAGKSTLLTGLPTPGRSLSVAVIIKVRQTRTHDNCIGDAAILYCDATMLAAGVVCTTVSDESRCINCRDTLRMVLVHEHCTIMERRRLDPEDD